MRRGIVDINDGMPDHYQQLQLRPSHSEKQTFLYFCYDRVMMRHVTTLRCAVQSRAATISI